MVAFAIFIFFPVYAMVYKLRGGKTPVAGKTYLFRLISTKINSAPVPEGKKEKSPRGGGIFGGGGGRQPCAAWGGGGGGFAAGRFRVEMDSVEKVRGNRWRDG